MFFYMYLRLGCNFNWLSLLYYTNGGAAILLIPGACGIMDNMKRRLSVLAVVMAMFTLGLSAGIFSGYDFSYNSTGTSDSLFAFQSDKFGLDYTGYGYLGDMTSGLYLRLGFQVPFATFQTLFAGDDKPQTAPPPSPGPSGGANDGSITSGSGNNVLQEEIPDVPRFTTFQVLASIGPSFRKFVSPDLSWYMGLGITLNQIRSNTSNRDGETLKLDNNVSLDIDFGYRVALHEHMTMRIGAFVTRPLFRLGVTTFLGKDEGEIDKGDGADQYVEQKVDDDMSGKPVYDFQQTIFTPIGQKSGVNFSGYIALGYTYASFQTENQYRYTITSPEYGTGIYELM